MFSVLYRIDVKDDGSKQEGTSAIKIVATSSPSINEPVRDDGRDSHPMETVSLMDTPQSSTPPHSMIKQETAAVALPKVETVMESVTTSTSAEKTTTIVKVESAAVEIVATKPTTTAAIEPIQVESTAPVPAPAPAPAAVPVESTTSATSSAKSGKNNKNNKNKGGKGASQQQQPTSVQITSTQPQKQGSTVVESKNASVVVEKRGETVGEKKVDSTPVVAAGTAAPAAVVSNPDPAQLALVTAVWSANTVRDEYEVKIRELMEQHDGHIQELQSKFDAVLVQNKEEVSGLREQLAIAIQQQQAIASSKNVDAGLEEMINAANRRATEAEAATKRIKTELDNAVAATTDRDQQLTKLTERVSKLNEVVAERERALETMAGKMAESHKALEEAQRKLGDLATEVAEKDSKLRTLQSQSTAASTGEGDVRKQLQRTQELLKEKEERMAAFENEGKSLAKKQSDMEKEVRKTKGDLKAKEGEVTKLKERQVELVKAIEEMQDLVRKNESDASNASKSLNAMQVGHE